MSQFSSGEILDWIEHGEGQSDDSKPQDRALLVDTAIGLAVYEKHRELAGAMVDINTQRRVAKSLIDRFYDPPVEAAFSPFGIMTNRGDSMIYLRHRVEDANPTISLEHSYKITKILARGIPGTSKVTATDSGISFEDDTLSVEDLERCPLIARRTANAIMRFLNLEAPAAAQAETAQHGHAA